MAGERVLVAAVAGPGDHEVADHDMAPIARSLRDRGLEVVHGGVVAAAEVVVATAVDEDVEVIALLSSDDDSLQVAITAVRAMGGDIAVAGGRDLATVCAAVDRAIVSRV